MIIKTWRKFVRRLSDGAFLGNGGVWVKNIVEATMYDDASAKDLNLIIPELRNGQAMIVDVQITYDYDE